MNKLVSSRHAAGHRRLHEPHLLSGSWTERWTDSMAVHLPIYLPI